VRQLAGREEEGAEVRLGSRQRLVGEIDEHDEDSHLAAQRSPLQRAASGDTQRRAEREIGPA
jgi:hypothetical protein